MLIDLFLSLGAAACVVAQAVMGYLVTTRPPPRRWRLAYELGFAAFALVGFVCVGVSAYRSTKEQNDLNAKIGDVEHKLDRLLNTQQNEYSAIQTGNASRVPVPPIVIREPPPSPVEHAHVIVDDVRYTPVDPSDASAGERISLSMHNTGKIAAVSVESTAVFGAFDASHLTETALAPELGSVRRSAIQSKRSGNWNEQEVGPGQSYIHQLEGGLNGRLWEEVTAGRLYSTVVVTTTYTDKSLPKGQFFVSEFCMFATGDMVDRKYCSRHNRTWIEK